MEEERLNQQIAYYRARSSEYDQWFLREGRYDKGHDQNAIWFAEVKEVQLALDDFGANGDVLELAGGTGIWTEHLAKFARALTVVDSSPEVIEINRARLKREDVQYIQADLFRWTADRQFDNVFFSFWLSHVPPERFASFWEKVKSWLKPHGRVFFIDSRFERSSTAVDHVLRDSSDTVVTRRLNDGREFEIYKIFYRLEDLDATLTALGWETNLHVTKNYFLFGSCRPSE